MRKYLVISMSVLTLIGCAHTTTRKGVMSQELPLTLSDLEEIRAGETNHQKILEQYRVFQNPKLEEYANKIAAGIAEVSTRPHLPYHIVILDTEEVNMFGGPGGYIYVTRGLFNFVESESEMAGLIAHEIGHISAYEYANIPHHSKIKFVYNNLLKGSEMAKDSIGSYGTALNYGLKGVGKAAPVIARRFAPDQEIQVDEKAVEYLIKAGYDPRALENFVERLSRVPMNDVGRFVIFMNTHPPFQDRRKVLKEYIARKNLPEKIGTIELKKDMLQEVRGTTLVTDSILFQPQFGFNRVAGIDMEAIQNTKEEKFAEPGRGSRRWGF